MFLSYIRAAVEAKLPPKQVIFEDTSHTEYDFWDLRLIKAYQFAQDFTRDGIPVWWDESDRVNFEVRKKVSRSRAAVGRAEEQDSKRSKGKVVHGRYYVPVPKSNDGGPLPTFREFAEASKRLEGRES